MAVARSAVNKSPRPAWTPSLTPQSASDVPRSGKKATGLESQSGACWPTFLADRYSLPINGRTPSMWKWTRYLLSSSLIPGAVQRRIALIFSGVLSSPSTVSDNRLPT